MKSLIIVCFLLMAGSIQAGTDSPTSSLRCDRYLVSPGAMQSEVLRKCGQPSNIETWDQERLKRDFYKDIPIQSPEQLSQDPLFLKEFVKIEEWEYNFGPTRFTYYLRFENGKLKRITVGSYGY